MMGGNKFTNRCIRAGLVRLLHEEGCHGGLLLMPNPSYHCEVTRKARDSVKYSKFSADMSDAISRWEETSSVQLTVEALKENGYIYIAWFVPPTWLSIVEQTLECKNSPQKPVEAMEALHKQIQLQQDSLQPGASIATPPMLRMSSEQSHSQDWTLSSFQKEDGFLSSLRDLQGERDLPLLRLLQTEGLQWITETFEASPQLVDIHYPALDYYAALHIHVKAESYPNSKVSISRPGLPLSELISLLEADSDIMQKAHLDYWMKDKDFATFTILHEWIHKPDNTGVVVLDHNNGAMEKQTYRFSKHRNYLKGKRPMWAPPQNELMEFDLTVVFMMQGLTPIKFGPDASVSQREVEFICNELAKNNVKVYCVVADKTENLESKNNTHFPLSPIKNPPSAHSTRNTIGNNITVVSHSEVWYQQSAAKEIPPNAVLMVGGTRSAEDFKQRGKMPAITNDTIFQQAIIQSWRGKVVVKCTDTIFLLRKVLAQHCNISQNRIDDVLNNPDSTNLGRKTATLADVVVKRKDIMYLAQFYNVEFFLDLTREEHDTVHPAGAYSIPFMEFALRINEMLPITLNPSHDFLYGGCRRGGKRMRQVAFWMGPVPGDESNGIAPMGALDETFNTLLVGNIGTGWHDHALAQELPWSPPEEIIERSVKSSEWVRKLATAKIQLVVGDDCEKGQKVFSSRVYEGILAGVVSLISTEFDPDRILFGEDRTLCDAVHVDSPRELHERMSLICSNEGYRLQLVLAQRAYVKQYVPDTFGERLKNTLLINSRQQLHYVDESEKKITNNRDLALLPKGQLHLHFLAAMRRATLCEWLLSLKENQLAQWRDDTQAELDAAANDSEHAKYVRRLEMITKPIDISAITGAIYESPQELQSMSNEHPQPGEAPIWDVQWIVAGLVKFHPRGVNQAETQLINELCDDARAEGIRWIELAKGIPIDKETGQVRDGYQAKWESRMRASADATERTGVGIGWVIHVPKKIEYVPVFVDFIQLLKPLTTKLSPGIVACGQWGKEVSPLCFVEQYKQMQDMLGLQACMLHAGEHHLQAGVSQEKYQGLKSMEEAVKVIHCRRIGHGIEAVKNLDLCQLLREENICLEICPISNLRLGYGNSCVSQQHGGSETKTHQIETLLKLGVACCLASDDPAYFGASSSQGLLREYEYGRHVIKLTDNQLAMCAKNSMIYSMAPEDIIQNAVGDIDVWLS